MVNWSTALIHIYDWLNHLVNEDNINLLFVSFLSIFGISATNHWNWSNKWTCHQWQRSKARFFFTTSYPCFRIGFQDGPLIFFRKYLASTSSPCFFSRIFDRCCISTQSHRPNWVSGSGQPWDLPRDESRYNVRRSGLRNFTHERTISSSCCIPLFFAHRHPQVVMAVYHMAVIYSCFQSPLNMCDSRSSILAWLAFLLWNPPWTGVSRGWE